AVVVGLVTFASAQDQVADPLIAMVNDVAIYESDVANATRDWGLSNVPGDSDQQKHDFILRYLTDSILLGKAAEQTKIPDETSTTRRVMFLRYKVLMERLLEVTASNAATEDALHKWYDKTIGAMIEEPEVHLRQVMLRVPDPSDKETVAAAEAKA